MTSIVSFLLANVFAAAVGSNADPNEWLWLKLAQSCHRIRDASSLWDRLLTLPALETPYHLMSQRQEI